MSIWTVAETQECHFGGMGNRWQGDGSPPDFCLEE